MHDCRRRSAAFFFLTDRSSFEKEDDDRDKGKRNTEMGPRPINFYGKESAKSNMKLKVNQAIWQDLPHLLDCLVKKLFFFTLLQSLSSTFMT
jgi:hypothetical protein